MRYIKENAFKYHDGCYNKVNDKGFYNLFIFKKIKNLNDTSV